MTGFRKLTLACALLGAAGAAHAKQTAPSLTGLAKALAAEQHCNVLLATERLELERTTENRRLSEVAKAPDVARQLYEDGLATGSKARCDSVTARAVKAVLKASRIAPSETAAAVKADPGKVTAGSNETPEAVAEKPVVERRPAVKPPASKKSAKPVETLQARSLASYGSMVESYYRELRCPSMSAGEINSFYRDVMRAHRKAVAAFGAGAAATAVRRAEARANAGSC